MSVRCPRSTRVVSLGLVLAIVSVGASACGSAEVPGGSTGRDGTRGPRDPAGPPDDGSPLTALPPCGPPPTATGSAEDVPGLLLPGDAIIVSIEVSEPLTTVRGYIATTPIRVRQFYEREPGLTILEIEDEIFEAETLVGSGAYRTYVKANATCQDGSSLFAVVGPSGTGAVPTPSGR